MRKLLGGAQLRIHGTPGLIIVYDHPGIFITDDFGRLIVVGQRAENWTWTAKVWPD